MVEERKEGSSPTPFPLSRSCGGRVDLRPHWCLGPGSGPQGSPEWEDAAQCLAGLAAQPEGDSSLRPRGGTAVSELRAGWSLRSRHSRHVPHVSYTLKKIIFHSFFPPAQLGYFLLPCLQIIYPFPVSNRALNPFIEFSLSFIMLFRIFILLKIFLTDYTSLGNSPSFHLFSHPSHPFS